MLNKIKQVNKIGLYSIIEKSLKLITGPAVLFIISAKLSAEELGYYFVFFSIIGLKQLIELGVGNVLKTFIAHAYTKSHDATLEETKQLILFSIAWFSAISIILLFSLLYIGDYYFQDTASSILWEDEWHILVFATFIGLLFTPLQIFHDAMQEQVKLRKVLVLSNFSYSCLLCIFIYNGCGLYSIGLAVLISNIILVLLLCSILPKIIKILKLPYKSELTVTFKKLWSISYRVSLVWGISYFFWNGFNLISFRVLGPNQSGLISMTLVLARTGFDIANSIVIGQSTFFSGLIANGSIDKANKIFIKSSVFSFVILNAGYILFFFFWYIFPEFYLFNKILSFKDALFIFLYFNIISIHYLMSSFVRSFKVEPFVKVSVLNAIVTPLIFYLCLHFKIDYPFLICSIPQVFVCIYIYNIYVQILGQRNVI
jgi:O-antigen/teichoic acid export membrane protein